ncbi:WXG100 family type VII secretion target [Micromonospora sp. CA-111912]|uniref:WXG100 family type VII secretion target n=1 Tax=Micromonospora sp. CA-111912 TaxID=3239955 RepID=UPI003D8B6E03
MTNPDEHPNEAIPYDYAGRRIVVNPTEVAGCAKELDRAAGEIETLIQSVHSIWEGLKLGWTGRTQAESEEFNELWLRAMSDMFASKDGEPGALSKIHYMANAAAANYAHAEDSLSKTLRDFWLALEGEGDRKLPSAVPYMPAGAPAPPPEPLKPGPRTAGPITEVIPASP